MDYVELKLYKKSILMSNIVRLFFDIATQEW